MTCVVECVSNIEDGTVSEDDNTEHRETRDRERVRTKLREREHSE